MIVDDYLNIEKIIQNLLICLSIKTKKELAERIKISPNSLNMLISRNSVGTLVEKILKNLDPEELELISFDGLFFSNSEEELKASFLAKKITPILLKNKKFKTNALESLGDFTSEIKAQKSIAIVAEKIKGQTALQKIVEYFSAEGERGLRILYFFLQHLKEKSISFTKEESIKKQFLFALNQFELKISREAMFLFTIKKSDKENLKTTLENTLDDASVYDILSNLDVAIKNTKNEMTKFDRMILFFS